MHLQTTIYSEQLGYDKHIRIFLPKGYQSSGATYPVIYMHDGQNLFHKKYAAYGMIWAIDRVLEQIGLEAIVVGIDSEPGDHRMIEYAPWVMDERFGINRYVGMGGKGVQHGQFVVDTLIPYIEKNYRTSGIRMIGGSSMGGIMSLYMGAMYPQIFQKVLAMSTAGWIFPQEMRECLRRYTPEHDQRVYMDIGTAESSDEGLDRHYLESNDAQSEQLKEQGITLLYVVEPNARHNEIAWNRRLPQALRFLFEE